MWFAFVRSNRELDGCDRFSLAPILSRELSWDEMTIPSQHLEVKHVA